MEAFDATFAAIHGEQPGEADDASMIAEALIHGEGENHARLMAALAAMSKADASATPQHAGHRITGDRVWGDGAPPADVCTDMANALSFVALMVDHAIWDDRELRRQQLSGLFLTLARAARSGSPQRARL